MVVFGVCTVGLSVVAWLAGIAIEYNQRSESGPVAYVPTLHHAVASGLLLAIGLVDLRFATQWPTHGWWIPILSLGAMGFGGWSIARAGRIAERRRDEAATKPIAAADARDRR